MSKILQFMILALEAKIIGFCAVQRVFLHMSDFQQPKEGTKNQT